MTHLLAFDIGNTNIVIGYFVDNKLIDHWRISTREGRTADEYALVLQGLLGQERFLGITAGVLSSVVPTAVASIEDLFKQYLNVSLFVVRGDCDMGMPILYKQPREVGADRIVNATAAYEQVNAGCIVVDFGTATTWDIVTPDGAYLGGVIAPGIQISAEALYQRAAVLPRVPFVKPPKVIGASTVEAMQSGMVYGYAGMVDTVITHIRSEIDFDTSCIATGGLASWIAEESQCIECVEPLLTLHGLALIFARNRG